MWAGVLAVAAPLQAQAPGAIGGALLEMPLTPRQVAFQGAYAAVVGTEGSVFINPAGMAAVHRLGIGASTERSRKGSRLWQSAMALRVGRFDLGLGAVFLDQPGDSADQGLAVGALAYRRGMFSLGMNAKYLNEHLHITGPTAVPGGAEGITGDLGIAIALFDIMALGYTMQNFTGRLTTDGVPVLLPRISRFGISLNIVDPQGVPRLLVTTDLVAARGHESYWAFGFEGGAVKRGVGFLGRFGVAAGREPSDRQGVSAGAELVLHSLRVEYAWQGYHSAGPATHRIGIRWTR